MDIVRGLNRTVLAAIHDLNIAAMYCTYIYILKEVNIVASGTPEEVLTKETIRDVYDVEARVIKDNDILRILYYPERGTT
jgi:iron complex transport system ATP-binding protein